MQDTTRPVVIFGAGDIAQMAHFYFTSQANRSVAAFVVDEEYKSESKLLGVPIVTTDEVQAGLPPSGHDGFVALSYSKMNDVRADKVAVLKALGYPMTSYVSARANVLTNKIGENCFILEDNTVQPFVTIGDNVTLWSGNHIGHHSTIGDNTFISSHVVVSGGVEVGKNCFIGVNATIRNHVRIAPYSLIGASALILEDTEEEGVYMAAGSEKRKIKSRRLRSI